MLSTGRCELLSEAALPAPIQIRHLKTAKRLRLRLDSGTGILKLTCPWGMSRRAALAWAIDQRDWVEAQLARAQPAEPFVPGSIIPIEGAPVRIVWDSAGRRSPELTGNQLRVGGPQGGVSRRIETFLRSRALEIMSKEVAQYASVAGVMPASVNVGDAATRWGSCSSDGRIRLSWRLILAPPEVRRYVVAHEVAHLRHLNHGADFKSLEARLYGLGLSDAKASLRRLGPRLRRIGRSS